MERLMHLPVLFLLRKCLVLQLYILTSHLMPEMKLRSSAKAHALHKLGSALGGENTQLMIYIKM